MEKYLHSRQTDDLCFARKGVLYHLLELPAVSFHLVVCADGQRPVDTKSGLETPSHPTHIQTTAAAGAGGIKFKLNPVYFQEIINATI